MIQLHLHVGLSQYLLLNIYHIFLLNMFHLNNSIDILNCCSQILFLTHFQRMSHFYAFWKHQKTEGFLMFLKGIEVEHLLKMG